MSRCEATGQITGSAGVTVRIVRTLECCGDEAKEATLDLSDEWSVDDSDGAQHVEKGADGKFRWRDGHGVVEVDADDPEQVEEGGGRYAKSYFGASVHYAVACVCGATLHEETMEDKVAASVMDDLL